MHARRIGEDAVLLECTDNAETRAAYERARRQFGNALDVVPAARTVLIDGVADPVSALAQVTDWDLSAQPPSPGDLVELAVTYDGPDLEDVARHWGIDVDAAVARHRDREYVVAFCGFAPGFAYCSGLPAEHSVPRLATPRTRVPPGSVGLADTWTGIYPGASPGGWRLVGRTDAELWRTDREPPALLTPGTRVRFVDA